MSLLMNAVIPLFAIIVCGFVAGRFSLLPNDAAPSLNSFVYYFALPALLFFSLANAPVDQITNKNFLLANIVLIISFYLLTVLIFKYVFRKSPKEIVMYGMMTTYGNAGFLGIPLLIAVFGQDATIPAAIAILIYDLAILVIVISSFEIMKQKTSGNLLSILSIIMKSVFLNPINVSLLIGFVVAFLKINTPEPLLVFSDILGSAAAPTALFSLGLGLASQKISLLKSAFRRAELLVLLLLKLVLLPFLAMVFVYTIFPIHNTMWAATVVILSAMPTGAMVHVFSEKYESLTKQVPAFILMTTIISLFTITGFLTWITDT